MPAIHDNLKTLRSTSGLSQTQVAEAINVTRQTVSSYETGRTQPDLETLKRLAELYESDLHDVLYGGNLQQRRMKLLRRFACVISALLLLSLLIHSALFLVANTLFAIENGVSITDQNRQLFTARFALIDAAGYIARIGAGIFNMGCLVMLYPLITMNKPLPVKKRLAWLLGLIAAAFAVVVPFMLIDKIYGYVDYLLPILNFIPGVVLLFLLSTASDVVRQIRSIRKQQNEK